MSSLRNKLIKGTIWNSIAQFGTVGFNFVLTFILARLLSPEDYGLLGMVTVITGFLGYFSEFGMIDSLVRKQNHDELDENTVFWGGIFFSVIIYILIYIISPYISLFYDKQELTSISRCASLVFIIGSYGIVPLALQFKELNYRAISIVSLISLFISGIIAILLAYKGLGVWTLVIQLLVQTLVSSVGYFLFIPWRPRFKFSIIRFRELLEFGLHRTFNNLIKFFSENIDRLLIGKILGSVPLGYYTMAFRLIRFPAEKFTSIFGKMLFPAFARMQNDTGRMRRNYLKVTILGGLIILPFVIILLFATEPLIRWTIGEKWMPICGLVRILAIYLLIFSISLADEPIVLLLGVKFLNFMKLLQSILLLGAGFYIVKEYNIAGMAWLYSACYLLYIITLKIKLYRILVYKQQTNN
ncbi:MAG: lipopolysaccharide biosynthesis protein [Sedimentisphaerales bacterium]